MKNLRFKNVWLLSRKEQTARQEDLSNPKTAILGQNKMGKSCLIKSLYQAFGADPEITHPNWRSANVEICVDFEIDDKPYSMVRKLGHYGIFDGNGSLILSTSKVTRELGPILGEMLGFGLKTTVGRGPEMVTPPPAYCFLPFYADQDKSWTATWTGFANLNAVSNTRRKCAEYHSGQRPNAYYEALGEQQATDRLISELKTERDVLNKAKARFDQKRQHLAIDLQPEAYGDRVEILINELQVLQAKQDQIKSDISCLVDERVLYVEQIRLSKIALDELDADYEYASTQPDEVICPTCGTPHSNDFVNRFSIAADADSCREIIAFGQGKIDELNDKIDKAQNRLNDIGKEAGRLHSVLSEERGKLRLRDILRGESERMLDTSFSEEFAALDAKISESMISSSNAEIRKKATRDNKRLKEISTTYKSFMTKFLHDLDVQTLREKDYSDIKGTIKTTGSELPRAILAYRFAFFHTMLKHSSSPLCPLVIDSPLQQDQDDENIPRILNFIVNNTPGNCQLVLGCVKLHGVDFDGHIIEARVKHKLLQEERFEFVKSKMDPLVNRLLR
ncbi:hypothetical protein GGD81_003193 [Rhodobium orientis]|uniref:Rad50/SbcC-type AAA domain-containing protein n=1 Tax=Rhodobium orientis TaxID=34017 RepID=A0A327JI29_9HYPH|nr:hypothetical protein [Rhodobium orientis]MBB4304137.1 hypothetical protein [Rhodobium orientis]MBK5948645.1 hypothetical protein [Rhodobium orientis]RAI24883.1 hypothetical protein CH339_20630 [Rhodobium orientis]